MTDVKQAIHSLLEGDKPPELEEIRSVRRRLAANPDSEQLAQRLIEIEKQIENEGGEPATLVRQLLEDKGGAEALRLSMDENEPFPDARREILKRSVERFGGSVNWGAERVVEITVPDQESSQYVRSLYHWSEVSRDE